MPLAKSTGPVKNAIRLALRQRASAASGPSAPGTHSGPSTAISSSARREDDGHHRNRRRATSCGGSVATARAQLLRDQPAGERAPVATTSRDGAHRHVEDDVDDAIGQAVEPDRSRAEEQPEQERVSAPSDEAGHVCCEDVGPRSRSGRARGGGRSGTAAARFPSPRASRNSDRVDRPAAARRAPRLRRPANASGTATSPPSEDGDVHPHRRASCTRAAAPSPPAARSESPSIRSRRSRAPEHDRRRARACC